MAKSKALQLPAVSESAVLRAARWEIPLPIGVRPHTLNEIMRGHWSNGGRLKRADRDLIALAAILAKAPKATGKRKVSLRLVVPKGRKRCDGDSLWKTVLDSLVHCDMLVDDGPDWCEIGPVVYETGYPLSTTIILEWSE